MGKYKLIVGVLVGVLLIGAIWYICKSENLAVSQISLTERDGLRLEVKTVDYSEKIVTLVFTNESDAAVGYNPWIWAMDREKDSEWYRMESKTGVIEIPLITSIVIESGETKEHSFAWGHRYGTVGSGTYRIYFELLNEEGDKDYIGVEFAINGWKELFL